MTQDEQDMVLNLQKAYHECERDLLFAQKRIRNLELDIQALKIDVERNMTPLQRSIKRSFQKHRQPTDTQGDTHEYK